MTAQITRRSFVVAFMAAAAAPAIAADPGRFVPFAQGDIWVCPGDTLSVETSPGKCAYTHISRTGVVRGVRVYSGGGFDLEWAQRAITS